MNKPKRVSRKKWEKCKKISKHFNCHVDDVLVQFNENLHNFFRKVVIEAPCSEHDI